MDDLETVVVHVPTIRFDDFQLNYFKIRKSTVYYKETAKRFHSFTNPRDSLRGGIANTHRLIPVLQVEDHPN